MATGEVIVVGAGMAGLAAAKALAEQGIAVTVLEARDRVGGRIHTVKSHSGHVPIELGAEFVHGAKNALWPLLRQIGLNAKEVPDRHWMFSERDLTEDDSFWEQIEQVIPKMACKGKDQNLDSFLRGQKGLSARARTMLLEYVEGFHAAEPERVSIQSLARAEAASEKDEGTKQFRLRSGYGAVVEWFETQARLNGAEFRFNAIAEKIDWARGDVEVQAATPQGRQRFASRVALITLPLGVLQSKGAEGVRFNPGLAEKERAIGKLAMGAVVKVVLEFRSRVWPEERMGFIHAPGHRFGTWWTNESQGGVLLTGWSGGKRATSMAELSPNEIRTLAIYSLSSMFHIERQRLKEMLLASYFHDWVGDCFSLGAYSYTPVGMTRVGSQLAEPVQDTLYFAGEATDTQGQQGTVHAALTSGHSAAEAIMRRFKRTSGKAHPRRRSMAVR